MAATPDVLVSVEEYLRTTYHPDCDYVDGVKEERNVGEGPHSRLQLAIGAYLFSVEQQLNVQAWVEQRVRISDTRYRVPDICVTTGKAPVQRIIERTPIICIEILSSEDRINRVVRRCNDYLQIRVPHVWIIDPLERVAFTYSATGLKLSDDGILIAQEINLTVNLAETFMRLDS